MQSMTINHAIDWQEIRSNLRVELNSIGYNPDLQKMLKNIDSMVTELSKLEVAARRNHSTIFTKEKVDQINKAIKHLQQFLLVAKLMK